MGLSIRKSAKIVGINIATSFFWRQKIVDCISSFLGTGYVGGVIEADEVFFTESFKGTRTYNTSRKSSKRCKEIKIIGISKEQICVASDFNLDHKCIKTGKHKEGIYHIQHINSLHSNLKKWMGRFNGISSKYISNYMQWFKILKIENLYL